MGVRCLAFFLAVAEANAFSAYSGYSEEGADMDHFEFRWRLAQSLMTYAVTRRAAVAALEAPSLRPRGALQEHRFVSLGNLSYGNYIRRHCISCYKETHHRCGCDVHKVYCRGCIAAHIANHQ